MATHQKRHTTQLPLKQSNKMHHSINQMTYFKSTLPPLYMEKEGSGAFGGHAMSRCVTGDSAHTSISSWCMLGDVGLAKMSGRWGAADNISVVSITNKSDSTSVFNKFLNLIRHSHFLLAIFCLGLSFWLISGFFVFFDLVETLWLPLIYVGLFILAIGCFFGLLAVCFRVVEDLDNQSNNTDSS